MPKDMIQHQLKRLRLPTIERQYKKLAQEAARDNRPYEDFLLSLLEVEVAQREENTRKRLIAQAHFPYLRTLDQFDFSLILSVIRAGVLELAKGEYLTKHENVVLIGNMGTGKTHTAWPSASWPASWASGSASTPPPAWPASSWRPRTSTPWANASLSWPGWTCSS